MEPNDLPYLIARWRFMRRAAASADFSPWQADYQRRAEHYALCIRAEICRRLGQ